MRINKKLMLLALLGLAIGFATVSTVLYIRGTINLMPDEEGFKEGVIFYDYAFTNADDGTIDAANTTGKTITFTTKDLSNVGDKAVLSYKIKNNSYYDANITGITCYFTAANTKDEKSTQTAKTNDYVKITPEAGFFPTTVAKQGGVSEATTLTVEQIKSYIGEDDLDLVYQCVIDATTDLTASATGDSAPVTP